MDTKLICVLLLISIVEYGFSKSIKQQLIDYNNEDIKYLAFVTNGDLYSCPCVIISKKHLLASGSCIRRHERGLEIVAGAIPHIHNIYNNNDDDDDDDDDDDVGNSGVYRTIKRIKYHAEFVNKIRSMRIHNSFVILTLRKSLPIGNNIKIAKLPVEDVKEGDEGTIYGWYQTCTIRSPPRFLSAPLTVLDRSNCSRIDDDEFCSSSEMTEKIIHSSPVISNGTIMGYTTYGCPSFNTDYTVTSVYYYLSFIKSAMKLHV